MQHFLPERGPICTNPLSEKPLNCDHLQKQILAVTNPVSAFQEMDENKDGQITEEEFIDACMTQKKFSTILTLKIIDVFVAE